MSRRGYIIATTPRTGSFLLSGALRATGVAGQPQEYAPPDDTATWRDYHGCATHVEYFSRFPDLCRTPNGMFGAKLMWLQFVAWGRDARCYLESGQSTPDIIRDMVGPLQIIRLKRRDRLRQAISWIRAQESGVWSHPVDEPQPVAGATRAYDAAALASALLRLDVQERNWDAGLALFPAPALTLVYEDLVADYAATVARALDFLHLPADLPIAGPFLTRQADEITEEWFSRARRDFPDRR